MHDLHLSFAGLLVPKASNLVVHAFWLRKTSSASGSIPKDFRDNFHHCGWFLLNPSKSKASGFPGFP